MLHRLSDDGSFERTAEAAAFVAAVGQRVVEGMRAFSAPAPARNAPKAPQSPAP